MKKLLFLFLLMSFGITAQNWDPINSANTYNYFSDTTISSACVIKTDSVFLSGVDSILYLNRILVYHPNGAGYDLKNQPQFLGRDAIKKTGGIITFRHSSHFTLLTQSLPGNTWIYDTTNNFSATTISVGTDSVLGHLDSIKTVASSNGDTITFSKNYGLVFFYRSIEAKAYRLKGIQNLNLGIHTPMFNDIYNYNVGDTLEYRVSISEAGHSVFSQWWKIRHYKLCILSKTLNGNTISYTAFNIDADTTSGGYMNPPIMTQSASNITLNYTNTTNNILNNYPHQIFSGISCSAANTPSHDEYKELLLGTDPTFSVNTKYCDYNYTTNNYTTGDTLQHTTMTCSMNETFGVGLGQILYYFYSYDGFNQIDSTVTLIGCVKSGIRYGHITPDWAFFSDVRSIVKNEFYIYPNPASDKLHVDGLKPGNTIQVYNSLGEIVFSETTHKYDEVLLLDKYAAGVYYLRVEGDDREPVFKKFIRN